jgi:phosphoribosylanthranilate isomerase
MRVRVKICGITRPEDGVAAARLGADAIGLVFYAPSPRHVTIAQAQAVCAALPPFVTVVGLFVDAPAPEVLAVLQAVPLDVLQFHGDEAPAYCAAFGRPWLKALRMRDGLDVAAEARRYAGAQGLLLDAYQPGQPGGTGTAFDWQRMPQGLDLPLILAGGLTPDNVAEAITVARPYAVDVSGGVEQAKGIKSADKMAAFMREVERVQSR